MKICEVELQSLAAAKNVNKAPTTYIRTAGSTSYVRFDVVIKCLALQLHKCKGISQGLATTAARASLATSRSLSASHKTRGHGPTVIEQSPLELVVSTI